MDLTQTKYTVEDNVALVTLSRPEHMNAFTVRMMEELLEIFRTADRDDTVRAIVVTGAGPNGRLWVTDKNAQLAVGAREFGLIPEEGLALPAMERGAHQFILKPAQGGDITFAYEIAENPTAWISLRTFRRLGTLRILTDVEDAKVIPGREDDGLPGLFVLRVQLRAVEHLAILEDLLAVVEGVGGIVRKVGGFLLARSE